ncbi:LysR family transcriptional regulator [Streptosporangium longisporum]|uniref:LysR family transcriptional regulator n=1 Tax=Streptosporangium longisporum TaxID=46187 RepID=A0ABP6L5T9_9ACTN
MDVPETRELAYFVAVAEELHFGRAARRLGMAQPPLSRAVQRLERRMGVTLLERTSRSVSLTPAGRVFLAESRKALDAAAAAMRRAQRAGREVPRLTVAMKSDGDAGLLERIIPLYRRDPDAVEVEVVVCEIGEQARMLRDGRVDLAFLHAPYDDLDGFDTELLLTEEHVAVLSRHHRLAGRAVLTPADLDDDPVPVWTGPQADGPQVRDPGQLVQLIALNQMTAVVPGSARRHLRPEVVCVPLLDPPRSSLLLAWPERTRSRAVAAFVRASTEIAAADPVGRRVPAL